MDVVMEQFQHLKIQLEEITLATNNFDHNNFVGGGGFGRVYKGVLARFKDRKMVAFKRLDRKYGQGDAEFLKEITFLSRYTHANIISLLGYCIQEKEMILLYEYASRGSLDRHLASADLTWTQRLKICLAAAKGLYYLHDPRETSQRLIHCDVKSANILLDDGWNAKVADFGLSKIAPVNQEYSMLLTNALGTVGYCDPLFMETYSLTKESDVYSFGVVLFEVLCGRLCYQTSNNGQLQVLVAMWKKCYEENKLDEIIFPNLRQNMDPMSLKTFSETAFRCLEEYREERPKMSLVMEKLGMALKCQEDFELQLQDPKGYKEVKEYEEIVQSAEPPLTYSSVKELKALLSNGFLVNGGTMAFKLDKESGKKCFMLGARHLQIGWQNDSRYWEWAHVAGSRFAEVAILKDVCWLKIEGKIGTRMLSRKSTYVAYFVFRISQHSHGLDVPAKTMVTIAGIENRTNDVYIQQRKREWEKKPAPAPRSTMRKDGWMEIELGEFYSDDGDEVECEMMFLETESWKSGLTVEGIEFRPKQSF